VVVQKNDKKKFFVCYVDVCSLKYYLMAAANQAHQLLQANGML
jgi:hypothetical protein